MAEPLPRYRSRALLSDVQRSDFAAGREQIRTTEAFGQTLSRMSAFAFGQLEEQAREKGLQYGAENPVTAEQIQTATAEGKDPDTLFQGQRGIFGRTVFGEAARAAQVAGVASDIQIQAQEKLNALTVGVERGDIPLDKARTDIQSMLDGYSNALVTVDPQTSLKLRAALATHANSTFLKITQTYIKKQDELRKVGVDAWVNNTLPGMIEAAIAAGSTLDPATGTKVTPQARIDTLKPVLMDQLAIIGDDAYARQAMEKFDKAVSRARVNAVSRFVAQDEFMRNPSGSLDRIRNGDLGAMSDVYKQMPAEEQEAVRKNFMEEAGRINTLASRAVKDAEDQAKNETFDLLSKYWVMPDGAAKNVLRNQIVEKGRGVITFDQLKTLLKPTGEGEEIVSREVDAQNLIRRGGVTDIAEVTRRVPGLKPKQIMRLQDMILDAGDRRLRESIRTLAGIPDGLVQMTGDQSRRFKALTEETERLKDEAIAKTGSYNPNIIIPKLVEAKAYQAIIKEVKEAEDSLQSYAATNPKAKDVTITVDTPESELNELGFNKDQIKSIKKLQEKVRGGK
jgi:hypothetical protein